MLKKAIKHRARTVTRTMAQIENRGISKSGAPALEAGCGFA
jgi:hypothetical protein